jgi:hypothetical protein
MQTTSFSDVEVAGGAVTPRAMLHCREAHVVTNTPDFHTESERPFEKVGSRRKSIDIRHGIPIVGGIATHSRRLLYSSGVVQSTIGSEQAKRLIFCEKERREGCFRDLESSFWVWNWAF